MKNYEDLIEVSVRRRAYIVWEAHTKDITLQEWKDDYKTEYDALNKIIVAATEVINNNERYRT